MKRDPKVTDAEFVVVHDPREDGPKPWWRRIYLRGGWWIAGAMMLGALGRGLATEVGPKYSPPPLGKSWAECVASEEAERACWPDSP